MSICAIIVSGGAGKRMGQKKHSILIKEHPLLAYTISVFEDSPLIDEIIVVLPKDDLVTTKKFFIKNYCFKKIKRWVYGGKRRQDSVKNGVMATTDKTDFILIHDGARPLVTKEVIKNVITGLKKSPAVVPVVMVRDSLRQLTRHKGNFSVPREDYCLSQTPQGFYNKMYKMILSKLPKKKEFSDDASMYDAAGVPVSLVDGDYINMKLTYPIDLELARPILEKKGYEILKKFIKKKNDKKKVYKGKKKK